MLMSELIITFAQKKALFAKSEHLILVPQSQCPAMETHKGITEECVTAANGTDDREARSKFWIAAYTRPKSEKKAAVELAKSDIETYVPIQTQIREWSDRRKKVEVVVIPMILFAKVAAEDILTVKKHPLIINVLGYPGRKQPADIPEVQIINLKYMLKDAGSPVTFIEHPFNLTDTVRVTRGNLVGLIGKIERITEGKTKLVVCLDMLGGAMVEIDSEDLEIYND